MELQDTLICTSRDGTVAVISLQELELYVLPVRNARDGADP